MTEVSWHQSGQGKSVLLIHGFPFHSGIWNPYTTLLSDQFRVITVDLPGFGKSAPLASPFTLAQVANTLVEWHQQQNIRDLAVVGHSLGGYVALAMVKQNPQMFSRLILFHSTAYADSAEKKESRTKVATFVKEHGALPFTTGFIPPLFADASHPAIENVRQIASEASAEAVIGYTMAMKDRPDQIKTLESFENPTLFLAGQQDPGIPVESILKQASHCQKPQIHIFEGVGHMGMLEKPAETAAEIKDFLSKNHA